MAKREDAGEKTKGEEMSMVDIRLKQTEMLDFYKRFDPVYFKYRVLLEHQESDVSRLDVYLQLQEYEEERQFAELTRKEFWDLQENLDMAYANRKITDSFLEIYDLICEKIIQNYIHIDGMERLFSEKFSEFEWEMHLGIDFKKHSMDFYRDHFIHQVKDAYSMAVLLERGGFCKKVYEILSDESSSKIARYVNKLIGQQLRLPQTIPYRDSHMKYSSEILKKHYMYNVIYMSSYIAGLFHDIGYPAAAALKDSQRMVDYLVEMHHFEQGGYDFRQIMSLLQNSLLFRIVSPQEIRGRIEGTKVDHGTMSALLLLLHFYENGAIHRLEPYKLCAVELAALAIYNHTNEYAYAGDEDAAYERAVFTLDPISYLLRICDDMQEWGRIYFEVSDKSNLIICNRCKMPILRRKLQEDNEGYEGDYDVEYRCSCSCATDDDGSLFAPMFRYKQFPYRRVHNITVCREVEIESDDEYKYRIHLKYDLDRLLHIAYINPDYAKYRIKELAKLKNFFPRQDRLGIVFLDYFVTSNIILIKSMIVGRYLMRPRNRVRKSVEDIKSYMSGIKIGELAETDKNKLYEKIEVAFDKLLMKYKTEIDSTISSDFEFCDKGYIKKCRRYLKDAFSVYIFIYLLICMGKTINTNGYLKGRESGDVLKEMLSLFMKNKNLSVFCSEEVNILLEDCCVQAGRMFTSLDAYTYYPEPYFTIYHSSDILYSTVKQFIDTEKYCSMIDKKEEKMQLDAYSDLYIIKKMLRTLLGK